MPTEALEKKPVNVLEFGLSGKRLTNRIFCLVMVLCSCLSGWGAECAAPPQDLVAWWRAEGTAEDAAGNNNGTIINGAAFAVGEVGQAIAFDGGNQYVHIPDAPSLNPTGGMTLEGWLYFPAIPNSDAVIVAAKRGPLEVQYQMALVNDWGRVSLRAEVALPDVLATAMGNTSLQTSTWYHWAMTYDGSFLRLYLNGAPDGTAEAHGFVILTRNPIVIGGIGASWSFNGRVDELSLYARALSDSELAGIFAAGALGKCITPVPPVVYAQPQSQTVLEGEAVAFSVTAAGSSPLFYQWLFNSSNAIAGATTSSLLLNEARLSDAGEYSVILSNSSGAVLSSNAVLTVNALPPCLAAPSGLAAWWPAAANPAEIVAGNNGTLMNGTTFAAGRVGRAFSFNGINQFVQVPDAPALNPENALSLEGWVYLNGTPGGDVVIIAGKRDPVWSVQYQMALLNNAGRWCLRAQVWVPGGLVDVAGSTGLQVARWHHWAMTYDGVHLRIYLDGNLQGSVAAQGPIMRTTMPFIMGGVGGGWSFNGRLDEVSLYSSALSGSEIQAIYDVNAGGKCPGTVPPSIATQPLSQIVTRGQTVTFSVQVSGTPPFQYQWTYNGVSIPGATESSFVIPNVQMADSGIYAVAVTNVSAWVLSSNASLTVNFPPAPVLVPDTFGEGGREVVLPIVLLANGNENALGFSLEFATARLAFERVSLGAQSTGASLIINTNLAISGKLGVAVSLPAGGTFAAGSNEVVRIHFTAAVLTSETSTPVTFGDAPTYRQLSDAFANSLSADYQTGTVFLSHTRFEADVAPRPDGDGATRITDWVMAGRFAAALDSPTNSSEFQRADCAPRTTAGDGAITVADWVQAGRYAAGLDALTLADGPTSPQNLVAPAKDLNRVVRFADTTLLQGQIATTALYLDAEGDENAIGASLSFDPAVFTFDNAVLGRNATAAVVNFNPSQTSSGRFAFVLSMPIGTHFFPGANELLRVSFRIAPSATGMHFISLTDQPVFRQVVDAAASELSCTFFDGQFSIHMLPSLRIEAVGENVLVAWPGWATNFVLQECPMPGSADPAWTNAAGLPFSTTSEQGITVPSRDTRFYRLKLLP